MPSRLVAYHRVSTARQGRSGLGLAAQEEAIEALARVRGAEVIASFTEVESGKRLDRPELLKALQLARLTGATFDRRECRPMGPRRAGRERSDASLDRAELKRDVVRRT